MRSLVLASCLAVGVRAAAQAPSPVPTPASRTIVGQIVSVDAAARTIVVRESVQTTRVKGQQTAKRETVSLTLDPEIQIHRGKKPTTISELKPQDVVVARYSVTPTGARVLSMRVAELATPKTPTPPTTPEGTPANPPEAGGQR